MRSSPTAGASMSASTMAASRRLPSPAPCRLAAAEAIDLGGALLVPGFVDGHIHLDKTLLGLPFQPHRPGDSVAERIAREKELRRELRYPGRDSARSV